MRRYIIFVNIALFILFMFLGMKGYRGLREFYQIKKGTVSLKGNLRRYTKPQKSLPASVIAGMGHSSNYYNVIPEKDLFRPEREEYERPLPSEEDEIQEVEDEISPPLIDLYGIMIEKHSRVALLYDKREKEKNLRYKVVSSGTEIQGYKLILIQPEQIIFEKNGRTATVKLSQKKSARGGIMGAGRKAPQIIKEGKGKDASLAVSVKKETPKKKSSKSRRSAAKEEEENAKYKIIDTPFGKLKRKIK